MQQETALYNSAVVVNGIPRPCLYNDPFLVKNDIGDGDSYII